MKEKEIITCWEFEKELKTMVVSCIGVKVDTAKKKASALLKKYDEIISSDKTSREYYEKKYYSLLTQFYALKNGRIEYKKVGGSGVLLLKDIEQIEERKDDVLLITKTGREIIMGSDFAFLKEIF